MTDPADLAIVELKPCPFCGGELLTIESCFVRCIRCGAEGPVMDDVPEGSEEDGSGSIWDTAIADLWNTRADSPEAAQCIEMLVEALEPLLGIIDEGISVNISDKALREQHPEDRSLIKRTRKALANANTALAKVRGR